MRKLNWDDPEVHVNTHQLFVLNFKNYGNIVKLLKLQNVNFLNDLQHPQLGKPRRGLQIMDTRMAFPCPFQHVVIDFINLN